MPNTTRLIVIAALMCGAVDARAQVTPASPAAALGTNALIGGIAAAVRAAAEHRDIARAFGMGALGGAVHYGGKWVAARHGTASGWAGTVIAGTGTSIVVNAGAGVQPLSEITMPLPAVRIRVRPLERSARLTFNSIEAYLIATNVGAAHTRVDWGRSASTGGFVVTTPRNIRVNDGRYVGGLDLGPVMIINQQSLAVLKHEATHMQQYWFADEAIGRPIENALRTRTRLTSWIPAWVDIGVVAPVLSLASDAVFGYGKAASNLLESEAYLLGR